MDVNEYNTSKKNVVIVIKI